MSMTSFEELFFCALPGPAHFFEPFFAPAGVRIRQRMHAGEFECAMWEASKAPAVQWRTKV